MQERFEVIAAVRLPLIVSPSAPPRDLGLPPLQITFLTVAAALGLRSECRLILSSFTASSRFD